MIKFKNLFETVYEPRAGDEKNFKDKHVIAKHKTPFESESQFTSKAKKAKRPSDYDTKDDEAVYEAASVHTKRADKEAIIVRDVDPKTGQSRARVIQRRAGEIKIGEEVELDEKVKNPYAVGMAAAMKVTGDRPPLKKSTIIKGHEIAKSIKNEAMDKVGKEDDDINNDGKVNNTDKYLHMRRRAINKAMKEETETSSSNASYDAYKKSNKSKKNASEFKESTQLDELSPNTLHRYIKKAAPDVAARTMSAVSPNQSAETKKHASKLGKRISGITSASGRLADKANMHEASDVTMKQLQKKFKDGTHEAMNDPVPGRHVELRNTKTGKRTTHYVKEETELNESDVKYVIKHKKTKQVLNTHDDYATAKDEHEGLGDEKSEYGVYKQTKKDAALRNRNTYREETEQIDEISKKTLGSYIKKASQSAVERHAVADRLNRRAFDVDNKDSERYFDASDRAYKKHKNRLAGIAKASDRLTKEEFDLNEAVKVGAMHLHDGSSVTVTREMADVLNNVLEQLNPMNRVKMEEKMHTSKKDFMEILKFAESI